jgi:DNA-binding transcriptional MerR regulator
VSPVCTVPRPVSLPGMRLRLDELAQHTGISSRNIRAYKERGLLPAPELEGRTGYYNEEHVQRLEIIGDLQARGFSLEAIRHTLDVWAQGRDLSGLLGFKHVISAPFAVEVPQRYTLAELLERFPEAARDPDVVIDRAATLGVLRRVDDTTLEAPSPMVIEAGAELVKLGVPLAAIFDLVEQLRSDTETIATRFVGIVSEHVIEPLVRGTGGPSTEDIVASLQRLRPIAIEVLRPFMAEQVAAAIVRAVEGYGLEATSVRTS